MTDRGLLCLLHLKSAAGATYASTTPAPRGHSRTLDLGFNVVALRRATRSTRTATRSKVALLVGGGGRVGLGDGLDRLFLNLWQVHPQNVEDAAACHVGLLAQRQHIANSNVAHLRIHME